MPKLLLRPGELKHSPRPSSRNIGATSKGKGRVGEGTGGEGKVRKGRGEEEREGE